MPIPKGQPMRVGDVWHADCGRVYRPTIFSHQPPPPSDPMTLADWLDIHTGSYGDPDMHDFCAEQRARDGGLVDAE